MRNNWTILCAADDHRTHKSEAPPRPAEGAVLPASIHPGARAHWCIASSRMVGTSCPTLLHIYSNSTEASWAVVVLCFFVLISYRWIYLCYKIISFLICFFNCKILYTVVWKSLCTLATSCSLLLTWAFRCLCVVSWPQDGVSRSAQESNTCSNN